MAKKDLTVKERLMYVETKIDILSESLDYIKKTVFGLFVSVLVGLIVQIGPKLIALAVK